MTRSAIYKDDEFYLILRGDQYYLHGTVDGRRIRKSCGTSDLARAKLFMEAKRREYLDGWREDYDRADRDWREVAGMICNRHRSSAVKRGIPFQLKPAQVYALMKATNFRCAVSGIPFAKSATRMGEVDPWGPSIDRLENRHGYLIDNIRVVSVAANIAMNEWGLDVLLRLARGVVNSSTRVSEELAHQLNSENEIADKPLIVLVK